MIRIWISRRADVPIREQLSSQILLGILSARIAPGEKLPSVREFARRLKIHSNTVSAAYADLASRGWLESRRGSGMYVLPRSGAVPAMGGKGCKILVCDPDAELARVLAAEVESAIGTTVEHSGSDSALQRIAAASRVFATSGQAANVRKALGEIELEILHLRSLPDLIAEARRPAGPALIAIVSRSQSVRDWAAKLISALGLDRDAILYRDPAEAGWRDGLSACAIVAADIVSARLLPAEMRPFPIRLVADSSLVALKESVTRLGLSASIAP